jgi:hypothetical protein
MYEIHDGSGMVIATVITQGQEQTVNDARGRNIGYSNANGTFDAQGVLVSADPGQFGLLLTRAAAD